jgi:hypothetical protein
MELAMISLIIQISIRKRSKNCFKLQLKFKEMMDNLSMTMRLMMMKSTMKKMMIMRYMRIVVEMRMI